MNFEDNYTRQGCFLSMMKNESLVLPVWGRLVVFIIKMTALPLIFGELNFDLAKLARPTRASLGIQPRVG